MASEVLSARRYSAEVNVLAFGADPTGLVDCRQAFEDAVTECKKRDYATLYVPAGKYKFDAPTAVPDWPTGSGAPPAPPPSAWQIMSVSGLCIRGDGALRSHSQEADFAGTTLIFDIPPDEEEVQVGLLLWKCTGIRFENITFQGAVQDDSENGPVPARDQRAIGVRIESLNGAVGSTGIQFQNCSFMWCDIAAQTGYSNNNSELAFYDCSFGVCTIGYQSLHIQAVVQKFVGCTGGGNGGDAEKDIMDAMFDLVEGGAITVVGFGGGNMRAFVRADGSGPNIGWNNFYNTRLEEQSPFSSQNRIRVYDAVDSASVNGGGRSVFHGLVIITTGSMPAAGHSRFNVYQGHEVHAWNIGRGSTVPIATAADPLLAFPTPELATRGGIFRCYGSNVPLDARVDRSDVPDGAVYSFEDCQESEVPYPDTMHPPLYGPNYLMSVESHCWGVDDALQGVNAVEIEGGTVEPATPSDAFRAGVIACTTASADDVSALASAPSAALLGGGTWRLRASVRVPTASTSSHQFLVLVGFGDDADPTNGVFFRYSDDINAGKWQGFVRNGMTTSAVNSDVSATGWHTLEILVDEQRNVTFAVDGEVLPSTLTGPTTALGLLPLQVERISAEGPAVVGAEIDYYKYEFRPMTRGQFYPE